MVAHDSQVFEKRLGHARETWIVSLRNDRPACRQLRCGEHLFGRRLEGLDLLGDELRLALLLVVDAAAHDHDLVHVDLVGVGGVGGVEDQELDLALEVVEGGEHHRVALLQLDALALGDHAADRDRGPVRILLLVREVGERAVDLRAQRRPHLLERVAREEQPERLLLPLVQLLPVVRQRHDRRVVVGPPPHCRRRSRRTSPCPLCASCCACTPAACARGSASIIPVRVPASESNAPHLTSESLAFLFTA